MNKFKYIIMAVMLASILSACNSRKVKFNPHERESTLSIQDRDSAIARKQRANKLNPDIMLYQHNVKLAIIGPAPHGEITTNTSLKVSSRLIQIGCQNGISTTGDSPCFALACMLSPVSKEATGTAPQKMICSYDAVMFVGNLITGDIYTGVTQRVTGAGSSFEDAANNAAQNIENTEDVQKMLQNAENIIISWYETNAQVFKNEVESHVKSGDLEMAFALLRSVPQQAAKCFSYANSRLPEVEIMLMTKHATEQLCEMQNAIAKAGDKYDPTVAACYKLIPPQTKEFKKAESLWNTYSKSIESARKDSIAWEKHKYNEELATERLRMKYTYEATQRAEKNAQSGNVSSKAPWKPVGEKKDGFFKDENGNIKWSNVGWTAAAVGGLGLAMAGAAAITGISAVLSHSLFLFII